MWTDSSSTLHFQNWADIDLERKSQKQGGTALTKGESQAVHTTRYEHVEFAVLFAKLFAMRKCFLTWAILFDSSAGRWLFNHVQELARCTECYQYAYFSQPLSKALSAVKAPLHQCTYIFYLNISKQIQEWQGCVPAPPPPSLNSCMKGLLGKIWLGMLWSFLVPSRSVHVGSLDSCWMEIPPLSKAFSSVCSAIMRGL